MTWCRSLWYTLSIHSSESQTVHYRWQTWDRDLIPTDPGLNNWAACWWQSFLFRFKIKTLPYGCHQFFNGNIGIRISCSYPFIGYCFTSWSQIVSTILIALWKARHGDHSHDGVLYSLMMCSSLPGKAAYFPSLWQPWFLAIHWFLLWGTRFHVLVLMEQRRLTLGFLRTYGRQLNHGFQADRSNHLPPVSTFANKILKQDENVMAH